MQSHAVIQMPAPGIGYECPVRRIESTTIDLRHTKGVDHTVRDIYAVASIAKTGITAVQDRHILEGVKSKGQIPAAIRRITVAKTPLPHTGNQSAVIDLHVLY